MAGDEPEAGNNGSGNGNGRGRQDNPGQGRGKSGDTPPGHDKRTKENK